MKTTVKNRKPYTVVVRVPRDERKVASAVTPKCETLLCKTKGMAAAALAAMLVGCICTTMDDEYSVADPGKSGYLRYEKVADLDSRVNYSADVIPVVLHTKEGQEKKDAMGGLHGIVWLCTVGLFPAWDTYERAWEVEVKTPVGVKSGVCTRTRREYLGWVPYLLPFAASDSEVNTDPSVELARRVAAQFKSEWTPERVAKLNTAEKDRIDAKRKRADALLAGQDWTAVLALCAGEKDNRFVDEYKGKVKDAEKKQLADAGNAIAGLMAKNEYEKAEKRLSDASARWNGVEGSDTAAWIALRDKVQKQKETFRVANKRKRLEGLMVQRKFEEVVKECASEGEPFSDLKAKADAVMKEEEAARIEKRKEELEQLLKAGKYDEVIAACEKERAAARLEYRSVWRECQATAIQRRLEAARKQLEGQIPAVTESRIGEIMELARKSAENGSNINFFGFFVGMSWYDAMALVKHYRLEDGEFSIKAGESQKDVVGIWFSLMGLQRIMKKGNTFREIFRSVEKHVGDMEMDMDSAVNDAFSSSFATVFSGGQKPLEVPKSKYVRKLISGVVARMYDGEEGGLFIGWKNAKEQVPTATETAKLEFNIHHRISSLEIAAKRALRELLNEKIISELITNMVAIPGKNFKMGKYEVTQAQWEAVMGENPSRFKGSENPVECVSWDDCKKFLEKLNSMPEVKESGLTFRLPTEKEWEYACRAGSTGDYCKLADGTEITKSTLGEVAWYDDNSDNKTHTVGQKKPNAFGLYDMHGNVLEWCEDLYLAGDSGRVFRGGGWLNGSGDCTASYGGLNDPDDRDIYLGFRVAASHD